MARISGLTAVGICMLLRGKKGVGEGILRVWSH